MKYLVIKTHLSHAIVIDENGRYLKVANLNYEVGQTVYNIFEMNIEDKPFIISPKVLATITTLAASFLIMFMVLINPIGQPYGSVVLSINPEVSISVNKDDIVTKLKPLNPDGEVLIEAYSFENKDLDTVFEELLEIAVDKGFLIEGETLSLTYDSKHAKWLSSQNTKLNGDYGHSISNKFKVSLIITNKKNNKSEIITPTPQKDVEEEEKPKDDVTSHPTKKDDNTNYGVSDYGDDTNYDDTDYEDDDSKFDDQNSDLDDDDDDDDDDSDFDN